MPVLLDSGRFGRRFFAANDHEYRMEAPSFRVSDHDCIQIGLVNNMPDLALEQTERQVLKLLHSAAGNLLVCLSLYALRDVPRGEFGQKHLIRLHYRCADDLWSNKLDGLIITGAEPRATDLTLEPYWHSLTEVFDWAESNTVSTIASCLAVHAGVFHFDGINRYPLEAKRFGVFEFQKVFDCDLLDGVPFRFPVPHSRWNEIRRDDLADAGYKILVAEDKCGVDTFIRDAKNRFLFFQGHPEYEAWTLLGEYRRDIARFLCGEQENYPQMPEGYFDHVSMTALERFRDRALRSRGTELMTSFPNEQLAGKLSDTWRAPARRIYEGWLKYIASKKSEQMAVFSSAAMPSVRVRD